MTELLFIVAFTFFCLPLVIAIYAAARLGKLRSELAALSRRVANFEMPRAPVAAPIAPPIERPKVVIPPTPRPPPPAPSPVAAAINWESILGVKLFAWIGGFAFFLGVVFFVKYAFERNLVTPVMRVSIGSVVGLLRWILRCAYRTGHPRDSDRL